MWLTNLADIARGAGLKVVEQPGWKTRGHGAQTGVRAIICHHTAGAAAGNAPSLLVVQNGRSNLAGPLSHFVLGRDGTVFVVAAGLCWHAGPTHNDSLYGNSYSIGIEAEATGTSSWPDVQIAAYAKLCRALCKAFGLSTDRVRGHKEVAKPTGRKPDPNFDMAKFRTLVSTADKAAVSQPILDRVSIPKDVSEVRVPASPTGQNAVVIALPGVAHRIVIAPGVDKNGVVQTLYMSGVQYSAGYNDDLGLLFSSQGATPPDAAHMRRPEIFRGNPDSLKAVIYYSSAVDFDVAVYRD